MWWNHFSFFLLLFLRLTSPTSPCCCCCCCCCCCYSSSSSSFSSSIHTVLEAGASARWWLLYVYLHISTIRWYYSCCLFGVCMYIVYCIVLQLVIYGMVVWWNRYEISTSPNSTLSLFPSPPGTLQSYVVHKACRSNVCKKVRAKPLILPYILYERRTKTQII